MHHDRHIHDSANHRLTATARSGGDRRTSCHRCEASAHDGDRNRTGKTDRTASGISIAHSNATSARTVRDQPCDDRLRRVDRRCRRHQHAWHQWRCRPTVGAHRRTSTVSGHLRPSHLRQLPEPDGRPRGSAARPCLGALWQQCHGRCAEYRHPENARGWREDHPRPWRRELRHPADRGHQSGAQWEIHIYCLCTIQPHRQPPQPHGL